ncbi:Wzz/FepE/Etk N-terminal domain-containing protein [Aquabacterium sp.]|uniref:Wzz/FepE/Etk N-terminal domain-containing protein n=1 Tax=Aquabacterium sp. TaxID=1872578 RepID=UPI002489A0FE|nr:Wzz/FepE/Etk N-terminal domain-containing protein [Aquabacterium sp.]MDI1259384.1 Wzz/FepE/Etk N-terminal domain-containing protein [Aquabacterium sp.]
MTEHSSDGKSSSPLIGLLITLGEGKRLLLVIALLGVAISIGCVLSMPRYYAATTIIMPPQQSQTSGVGALAQLGLLPAMAGNSLGFKSADDTYIAFLKTRRLQDVLIARFQLQSRYEVNSVEAARFALTDLVNAVPDKKSGLITITVEDTDPKFAVELANAHVSELRKMLSKIALTEAQQRRIFFEGQVTAARDALTKAEALFLREQARSGFVVTQAFAETSLRANVELRAQILIKEVNLQALSRFATPQNSDMQRLRAELAALRSQLTLLESGQGARVSGATSDAGERDGGALGAFREMKVREAALEALVRQFELAKLDESKEGPLFQQVDEASASAIPSRPKRAQFVALAALLSLLFGSFLVVVRAKLRGTETDDERAWQKLLRAWKL